MSGKVIVLDANILIRAVLGKRVRELILEHARTVRFVTPDVAFSDARKYLPDLLTRRGVDVQATMRVLDHLEAIVHPLDSEPYADMRQAAMQRIAARDAADWPVLACALLLDCPVWTQDTDFFGTGVPTWTSGRVVLYFS